MPHREPLVHFDLDCRIPGRHRRSGRVLHHSRLVGAYVPSLRLAALRAAVVGPVPSSLRGLFLCIIRFTAGNLRAHLVSRARPTPCVIRASELGSARRRAARSFPPARGDQQWVATGIGTGIGCARSPAASDVSGTVVVIAIDARQHKNVLIDQPLGRASKASSPRPPGLAAKPKPSPRNGL